MEIAYLTDVEGNWDKLASFATDNPRVALDGDALRLADGVTFVFGGDAIDRGPHARRIVRTLLAARRTYGDRVILLAGNRDLNKLRLVRELDGAPPARAPAGLSGAPLLRWILANTMGAARAFEYRAIELAAEGRGADDDAVVRSFLDDIDGAARCGRTSASAAWAFAPGRRSSCTAASPPTTSASRPAPPAPTASTTGSSRSTPSTGRASPSSPPPVPPRRWSRTRRPCRARAAIRAAWSTPGRPTPTRTRSCPSPR